MPCRCCDCSPCGFFCTACGGPHLLNGGTVTDSIGTQHFTWFPGSGTFFSGIGDPGSAGAWTPLSGETWFIDGSTGDCVVGSLLATYGHIYELRCNLDGTLTLSMLTLPVQTCPIDATICGYLNFNGSSVPTFLPDFADTQTPTCSDGVMTASFSWPDNTVSCPGKTIHAPAGSATISVPIEPPGCSVCCSPCPIPEADLTLTYKLDGVTTTTTLAFDSGGPSWGDGTNTLSCAPGSGLISFHDSFGNHGVPADYICTPLHLHYAYSSGGHTIEVDIDA
jgi:hypothetical protein